MFRRGSRTPGSRIRHEVLIIPPDATVRVSPRWKRANVWTNLPLQEAFVGVAALKSSSFRLALKRAARTLDTVDDDPTRCRRCERRGCSLTGKRTSRPSYNPRTPVRRSADLRVRTQPCTTPDQFHHPDGTAVLAGLPMGQMLEQRRAGHPGPDEASVVHYGRSGLPARIDDFRDVGQPRHTSQEMLG
jgi:hypothetical protein